MAPTALAPGRDTFATVESWLPDPGMDAIASDAALRVSAAGLARQVALCSGLALAGDLCDHPLRKSDGGLYGEPHSPHFDFASSTARAGWIDRLARRAVADRDADATRQVVGHTDWSARNVRLDEERLLAVYDWDSVALRRGEHGRRAGRHHLASHRWSREGQVLPLGLTRWSATSPRSRGRRGAPPLVVTVESGGRGGRRTSSLTPRGCELSLEASGVKRMDNSAARHRLAESGEQLLALAAP